MVPDMTVFLNMLGDIRIHNAPIVLKVNLRILFKSG